MDVPKDSAARLDAGLHWQTSTGGLVKPRHPGTQTAALIHGGKTGGRAVCQGPQTPRFRQMNGGRQAWKPGTRQLSAEGRAGQGRSGSRGRSAVPERSGRPARRPRPSVPGPGPCRAWRAGPHCAPGAGMGPRGHRGRPTGRLWPRGDPDPGGAAAAYGLTPAWSHGGSRPPGRTPRPTAPASPPGPTRSRRVAGNTSRRSNSRRRRELMARPLRRPGPDRESSRPLRREWRYSSSGLRGRGGARTAHGLRHAPPT